MTSAPVQRILHVPRRFAAGEWGGTETVVLEISREQQRAGWRPEIFTTLALSDQAGETIAGVPVRRFKYFYPYFGLRAADRRALDKKGGNLVSPALLRALLRAENVRLFHAHAHMRLGGHVRTAARWRRKPYVVSLHGGAFDYPASELDTLLAPTRGKLEWGKALGALLGSRRVLADADCVICVGQAELEAAKKNIPHDRVAYLPNGVDPDKFARGDGAAFRRKHGIPGGALLIANVSRIDAQKNQLALVEAFAQLRANVPGSFLLLMGPETQADYAARLRALIRERQLEPAVKILPGVRTDDPELVNAYHACDIFALPSIHEPFGIVVLEAWSAGKAVIASRVGGLKTLVEHERTGFLFDPAASNGVDKLAGSLRQLAADAALRRRLGEAGRDEVRARYTWAAVAAQLEAIYQRAERHAESKR